MLRLSERGPDVAAAEDEVGVHISEHEQVEGRRHAPQPTVRVGSGRPYDALTVGRIELIRGDITQETCDAIVNAANASLMGGGGVDGAIHRRGGPAILEACRAIRRTSHPDGLPTGEAVATTAGDLPARWVIHTVGPVYRSERDPASLLARCHVSSLLVADELGARTVAFPAISTGVYGYPFDEAASVAIRTVRDASTTVDLVRFVLFGDEALAAFDEALANG
jgi:O-acetyl-ADP-ribose deacetylase